MPVDLGQNSQGREVVPQRRSLLWWERHGHGIQCDGVLVPSASERSLASLSASEDEGESSSTAMTREECGRIRALIGNVTSHMRAERSGLNHRLTTPRRPLQPGHSSPGATQQLNQSRTPSPVSRSYTLSGSPHRSSPGTNDGSDTDDPWSLGGLDDSRRVLANRSNDALTTMGACRAEHVPVPLPVSAAMKSVVARLNMASLRRSRVLCDLVASPLNRSMLSPSKSPGLGLGPSPRSLPQLMHRALDLRLRTPKP